MSTDETQPLTQAQMLAEEAAHVRSLREANAAVATCVRNFGLNLIPIVALAAAFILFINALVQSAGWGGMVAGNGRLAAGFALIAIAVHAAARGLATTTSPIRDLAAAEPAWACAILVNQ